MLIRHAEKPGQDSPGPGLTAEGVPDKKCLVIRGWQRAGAWAALFGNAPASGDYPRPTALYTAKPDDDDGAGNPSRRPYETILPLSQKLRLDPIVDFPKGEEERLANQLAQLTGCVLVCWEHKAIVEALLPSLLGGQRIAGIPGSWDDARFDVVLRLDRSIPTAPWSFRQLFPRLLGGDTDLPL